MLTRPYGVVNRSAWLPLLVPDGAWFSVVFGRCCSEVAPNTYTPKIRDSGRLTPLTSHSDANKSKRVGDPDE